MRTIYLDMDGVIADFNSKTIELIGKRLRDFADLRVAWAAMDEHKDIYAMLDPMPDAAVLVNRVLDLSRIHNFHVAVLTAIPKFGRIPLAKQHKREWLETHFPILLNDFNVGPHAEHKQFHCQPGDILIDDSKLNIPQWITRGGIGILHVSAEQSSKELQKHLAVT